MSGALSDREKLCWLRLSRTENVGPVTFRRLMERYGSAENALKALPDLAKRGGRAKPLVAQPLDAAEKEIGQIEKFGARLIAACEDDYPAYLTEIDDAPPLVTIMGHSAVFTKPALGVVGARNASLAGRKIAADYAGKTAAAGYVIVSGLARGIDSAAHLASVDTGTVAVVAGGIDVIYPPENKDLYRRICEQGAVVAESPFSTEPLARHFPRRNRIISGLSLGVLVVEAAMKSGSLITARMALEQNREVFAVPGSPLDPRAAGTNSLIRDGAHMAACAEDIIHVLRSLRLKPMRDPADKGWKNDAGLFAPAPAKDPEPALRNRILESLSPVPVQMDELIRAMNAPIGDVLTVILELELAGRIERQAGNKVNLI
ncbi:MAG: DNA-protecting protein DprA [Alphaproteobacteria bacterium]|nr:DNA-protecting protein DprA [Alphaproteobacteria bacterium]